MGIRRKAREIALQFLFQRDFQGTGEECDTLADELEVFGQCFEVRKKSLPYALQLLNGICERLPLVDEYIITHSHNWRLDRMSVLDRNILRIAVFELCFAPDIPDRVAINEAVEIAKRYGTEDSPSFINGILDAVKKSVDARS